MAPGDGRVIPLEVADCSSVELAICQENIPMGTAPWHGLPSLLRAWSDPSPAHLAWGAQRKEWELGEAKPKGSAGSLCTENQHGRVPPAQAWGPPDPCPGSLNEPTLPPTLTNHQGRGLEIGVKGTTTLAIFQEDIPRLILCQREVLHVLQGSRQKGSGTRQWKEGDAR